MRRAGDGKVGDHVGALPGDTAAVLALAVPEILKKGLEDDTKGSHFSLMKMLAPARASTSLDLIDFLGQPLSISLGGDAPADMDDLSGPGDLPVARSSTVTRSRSR